MKTIHLLALPWVFLLLVASARAQSSVPSLINYQGFVSDSSGPLGMSSPENRIVTFRFWSHATNTDAASRLYTESQTVTFNGGDFSVLIGQGSPTGESAVYLTVDEVFEATDVFLGITVDDGNPSSADAEISPRQQIVSTAYAFRAKVAERVDSLAISTNMIANNAVTANQLRDSAVTLSKMSLNSVDGNAIVNSSVTSLDLAGNSVGTSQIQSSAVTGAKIAAGTIQSSDLGPGSVNGGSGGVIADGSITSADLGSNSVGFSELQGSSVNSTIIANGSVTSSHLGSGTITAGETLKMIRGSATASGGFHTPGVVHGPISGSGFTWKRESQGRVEVYFNTAFAGPPTVVATVNSRGGVFCQVESLGGGGNPERTGFAIFLWNNNGTPLDWPFNFIAVGPR